MMMRVGKARRVLRILKEAATTTTIDDDDGAKVPGKMEANKRRKLRNPDADMRDIEESYAVKDSSLPRNP